MTLSTGLPYEDETGLFSLPGLFYEDEARALRLPVNVMHYVGTVTDEPNLSQ